MSTDTSEQGLESLIVEAMTGLAHSSAGEGGANPGGTGWILGNSKSYHRGYALDLVQLFAAPRK
jgi:type I restriction enzyme, R subunit